MLHIVLFRPEIPQNTGNIGRMCAFTRSRLHLIRPLGFAIDGAKLKRSGMDYWNSLDLHIHPDWESFLRFTGGPRRLWLFTTKANRSFWDAAFAEEDGLVFGSEGSGAPDWLHDWFGENRKLYLPRFQDHLRSLNLSTCAGIATYEALRQLRGPTFMNNTGPTAE